MSQSLRRASFLPVVGEEWGAGQRDVLRGLGLVAGFLLLLLICAVIGFEVFQARKGSQADAAVEAIRAEGLPTSAVELDDWYGTDPLAGQAAERIVDAGMKFRLVELDAPVPFLTKGQEPELTEPLSPEMRTAIESALASNAECLASLKAALMHEEYRYPIDLRLGHATSLPHLDPVRNLARLLALDAMYAAESGDAQAAVESAIDCLHLGETLRKEPLIISQLVRFAVRKLAIDALEQAVNRTELSDAQLAELMEAIRSVEDPDALFTGFVGERANALTYFEDVSSGRLPSAGGMSILTRALGGTERSEYLQWMNEMVAISRERNPQRRTDAEALDARLDSALTGSWYTRILAPQAAILMPALSNSLRLADRDAVVMGTAYAALACERYRLKNGAWALKLDDLVPEFLETIPVDEMNGANPPVRLDVWTNRIEVSGGGTFLSGSTATRPSGQVVRMAGDSQRDLICFAITR